jgi:glucose/arabinose dehydrogenase
VNFPGSEQGLLGLAFHPDYANNGYFYVNYTRDGDGNTIVARYSVSADPNVANTTGTTILMVEQPYSNHNGGTIKFGPDGYLYIGMGDGGSGDDPGNYGQNINENLGKMLRIDVNSGSPYSNPSTNPFVGVAGNDEIWATGLRNPWKFSFNRLNGDLWIADVGQYEVEEVNKITAPLPNTGLNFGWRCFEGSDPYIGGPDCPTFANTVEPYTEYTHSSTGGCSITGGYYYTGSMFPSFNGKYFFADYCTRRIGTTDASGTIVWTPQFSESITSFGEDVNGELYVTGGSRVFKVVDETAAITSITFGEFQLSPNPAKEAATITSTNQTSIKAVSLTDLSGKTVLTHFANESTHVSLVLADLNSGIYLVTVEDINGRFYQSKFVKQ